MNTSIQSRERTARFLEGLPSAVFQKTLSTARLYAENGFVSILVTGPIGAGKTQLLNYVHSRSPRGAFGHEIVTLSGVDEQFSLSRLFGHVKGAYTGAMRTREGAFQRAKGGTVSLDELAKSSIAVQKHLLEVLDRGIFAPLGSDDFQRSECRILAATNVALVPLVEQGLFLEDLLSRIDGFQVDIPPLSERREDIPSWAGWFLERSWQHWGHDSEPPVYDPDLLHALKTAPLLHNLRELEQIVQRLLIEARGARVLTPAHCQRELAYLVGGARRLRDYTLEELEELLRQHQHRVSRAADRIGVHRASFHKHLKSLRAEASRRAS